MYHRRLLCFFAFFVVCVASIIYLWKNSDWWDAVALSAAEIGVGFCTLVLITGPIWARPIWGTWWSWDPTLTLTLVLWLIYVAYLMLRIEAYDPKRARFAAILGIVGFADVPLIRWSVEKWRTLHPKPVLMQEGGTTGLTPAMLLTFLVCLVAFLLLFFYLLRERVSIAQSRHALTVLRHKIDEILVG
jgi:heme exporter protein C